MSWLNLVSLSTMRGTTTVPMPVDTISATIGTLTMANANHYVRTTNAAFASLIIEPDEVENWADNTEIIIHQGGSGTVELVETGTVTINSPVGKKTVNIHESIFIKKVGLSTWDVIASV